MNTPSTGDYATQETRLAAFLTRERAANGHFFVAVRTTGIFCLPCCPARPKVENIAFHDSRESCLAAGFRACKRCRP